MVPDAPSAQSTTTLLVTISADPRWLPTTAAVTAKVAEQIGFGETDAGEIGAVVELAAGLIIRHPHAASSDLRMTYGIGERGFELTLEYRGGPSAPELGRALRHPAPGTHAGSAEAAMDIIELIDRPDGSRRCRLGRQLP